MYTTLPYLPWVHPSCTTSTYVYTAASTADPGPQQWRKTSLGSGRGIILVILVILVVLAQDCHASSEAPSGLGKSGKSRIG